MALLSEREDINSSETPSGILPGFWIDRIIRRVGVHDLTTSEPWNVILFDIPSSLYFYARPSGLDWSLGVFRTGVSGYWQLFGMISKVHVNR
jgi:hypothetical protein